MPHPAPRHTFRYPDRSGGSAWHTNKPEEAVHRACIDVANELHRSGGYYTLPSGQEKKKVARRFITHERDGNYYIVPLRKGHGAGSKGRAPRRTVIAVWATDPFDVKVRERVFTGRRLGGEWSCEEEYDRAEREARRMRERSKR